MIPKVATLSRHLPANTTGISVRKNVKNGFVVVELDYFADPMKDAEWVAREKPKMAPKQWAVEMERSWETFAGRPVYEGAFNSQLHVLREPQQPSPDTPIIFRGWDFGANQSCAIAQIQGSRLIVLDEIPNGGLNTRRFAPDVISFCNQTYGTHFHYIDIIDPSAMWEGKTAEGKACADVLRELDIDPIPASTNDPQKRIDAVLHLLMSLGDNGTPNLVLNPQCQMLIKGFAGGYHLPEKPSQHKRMDRPIKNLYSHIHDALQYIALRMHQHRTERTEELDYEASLTRYKFTRDS